MRVVERSTIGRRQLLVGSIATLAVAACSGSRERPLAFSLPWRDSEFHTRNARVFAAAVAEATEFRVDIRVHSGASLGVKGPQSIRALEENIVQLADISGFQQVGSAPLLGLESLPLLIDDMDELALLWLRLRPLVDSLFAGWGLVVLYVVPWPQQNIFTRRRIDTVEDLVGLRIRSQAPVMTSFSRQLGMAPIQLTNPETVPALATGMIEAIATSTSTAAAQKYWEFLRYTYRTNHLWSSNIVAMNGRAWDRILEEDRSRILDLSRQLETEFWDVSRRDDTEQLALLERMGMETLVPAGAVIDRMREAGRPIWTRFAETLDPDGAAVLEWFLRETGRIG